MKKVANLEEAKQSVERLLGKPVSLRLNRGRNRVKNCVGILCEAYPNVFVVKLQNELFDRISCTYTDVLCGEVVVKEQPLPR